ncbi:MAG: nuclear transport factor 2 family protein [Desulfobacterium sp.]|nr:nuclear transport factor 2 family protein [Desulfobacterium sp.]
MHKNDICRQLQDKEEIKDILHRYHRASFLNDEAMKRSCWHPDGTDDHAGFISGTIDEVLPVFFKMRKNIKLSHMCLSNIVIKLDGDFADCESYVADCHVFENEGQTYHWLAGGRYVDRFERRNGEWRILNRASYMDWNRTERVDSNMPTPF